jgi:hypothetical protein
MDITTIKIYNDNIQGYSSPTLEQSKKGWEIHEVLLDGF